MKNCPYCRSTNLRRTISPYEWSCLDCGACEAAGARLIPSPWNPPEGLDRAVRAGQIEAYRKKREEEIARDMFNRDLHRAGDVEYGIPPPALLSVTPTSLLAIFFTGAAIGAALTAFLQ